MGGDGCRAVREVLSAGLDGESAPDEQATADAHLVTCPDCRRWLDDAAAVTRLARASLVSGSVDASEAALAAAPGRGRARVALVLRCLLLALGVAQLLLAAFQVVALSTDEHVHDAAARGGAAPGHLWHESAAWNAAVGAAFLWVAARRRPSAGIVAILSVFLGALLLLSAGDVIAGRVAVARLASHGFVLAGYAVVLLLSVPRLGLGGPPGRAAGGLTPRHSDIGANDDSGGPEPERLAPVVPLPRRVRTVWQNHRWRNAA